MDLKSILKVCIFTPGMGGRWGLPVLFWGSPGVGKSRRIEATCREFGLVCHTLVASIREPSDFGGLPIPVTKGKSHFVAYSPPLWAADLELENDSRGVVFTDELTTTSPATQAALLRMILDGCLGDYKFSSGVRFIAAANPPAEAAGGWDLTMPLANRFGHLQWEIPSVADWTDWLLGVESSESNDNEELSSEKAAREESRVLAAWPTHFARARGLVAGFLKSRPELLFKLPEVGSASRSRAWPSPRTFELLTRALGGCAAHGVGELVTDELASAFVGGGVAAELVSFRKTADLPDPEDVVDGRVPFKHQPRRLDRTVAILSSCAALVSHDGCKRQAERASKLWEIIGETENGSLKIPGDLIVPCARQLVRKRLHRGDAAKNALIALQPLLEAAGVRP